MFCETLKITPDSHFASKDAIIHDDGRGKTDKLTYGQLFNEINSVAETLRNAGVAKGDRVLLVSENHLHWLPMFLGIANSGGIAVPVDGNIAVSRFHAIVEDCRPAAVIVSRRFEARFAEFMLSGNEIHTTLNLYFDVFLMSGEKKEPVAACELKPHDIAAIIYTSGTTGRPKGIMLSHCAFVESIVMGLEISGYTRDDRMQTLLPFTHVFSLVDSGLVMLHCYSTLVVCNSFNPAEIMQVMMKHRITYLLAVPRLSELFAAGLMQAPDLKLPGLTMIIGGAAPRPQVMKLMQSRGIRTFQGFGMTETAAGILIGLNCPIESVGKPLMKVKIKINKPKNGVGELLISTPTIFSGVFGQPELDKELFEGEFFKTGDLAEVDADGHVYIRGRAKEVIISSSGLNVYPDELELRLGNLPYAEEYVVFGYCEDGLEIPAIALVGRNEFFKDYSIGKVEEYVEEDIRKKCSDWPEAERLRRVFIMEKPLPRSASAKVKRFEVSAMLSPDAKPESVQAVPPDSAAASHNEKLVEMFLKEIAAFLKIDTARISLKTRVDKFIQLDSLGVVAMLINLEKRFNTSLRDFIGASVETFEELFNYLAEHVDLESVFAAVPAAEDGLPPMLDFSKEALEARQNFVRRELAGEDFALPMPAAPDKFSGNIEGFAGFVEVPVGICGPLKVNGQNASGDFYLPLATTEGALVSSVARGCQIISLSGGAEVRIIADSVVRTPVFVFSSLADLDHFSGWIKANFAAVKGAAESTTAHGRLLEIEEFPIGTQMVLRFVYSTGDASGQNMTTIATRTAVDYILQKYDARIEEWFLESNLSGDKKINSINFTRNRGKKVVAACRIPRDIIQKHLHTTPEKMCRLADLALITSVQAGGFGVQAHYANTLAAVYIAAGQDPACVAESAAGITHLQNSGSDLLISVTLPGLMVGTVGGGTRLATQNSCLQIMGCAGAGYAGKFAEILAAGVLAGEISIIGAMAADEFTSAHARYGRSGGMK